MGRVGGQVRPAFAVLSLPSVARAVPVGAGAAEGAADGTGGVARVAAKGARWCGWRGRTGAGRQGRLKSRAGYMQIPRGFTPLFHPLPRSLVVALTLRVFPVSTARLLAWSLALRPMRFGYGGNKPRGLAGSPLFSSIFAWDRSGCIFAAFPEAPQQPRHLCGGG